MRSTLRPHTVGIESNDTCRHCGIRLSDVRDVHATKCIESDGHSWAKPRKKKRRRDEHRQQEIFVSWARLRGLLLFHPANELVGQVSKARAAELKRLGVAKGVPDIWIIDRGVNVVIEFKGPRGSRTAEQQWWMERLTALGWRALVTKSAEEAKAFCLEVGL